MNFKTVALYFLAGVTIFSGLAGKVMAQYTYGGGSVKSIVIDKKVGQLGINQYLDNISYNQKIFFENEIVEYKVRVENTGNESLQNIKVKDFLPSYLVLILYPGQKDKNLVTWEISTLGPGESREYLIKAKVEELSSGFGRKMLTNKAEVRVGDLYDSDTASFFIGNKEVPETGGTSVFSISLILLSSIGLAIVIRKLARGF